MNTHRDRQPACSTPTLAHPSPPQGRRLSPTALLFEENQHFLHMGYAGPRADHGLRSPSSKNYCWRLRACILPEVHTRLVSHAEAPSPPNFRISLPLLSPASSHAQDSPRPPPPPCSGSAPFTQDSVRQPRATRYSARHLLCPAPCAVFCTELASPLSRRQSGLRFLVRKGKAKPKAPRPHASCIRSFVSSIRTLAYVSL